MKRIALVNQRYGMEVNGGSEYYTRLLAKQLSKSFQVEVLTTTALSYEKWDNYYEAGTEQIDDITVRRFRVEKPRAVYTQRAVGKLLNKTHFKSRFFNRLWVDAQGPYAPGLIQYIEDKKEEYDIFIFVTYLYYSTVYGMPKVREKAIFIPTAHDEYCIYYDIYKELFSMPKGIVFLTEEEKQFVHTTFKNDEIPHIVAGAGVEVPSEVKAERFREKYQIQGRYLIYTGRVDENKGCGQMFQAYLEYKAKSKKPLELVVVGQKFMDIPSEESIHYLGFVSEEDKFDAIAGAEALWLPSEFESLSISVLEAMAMSRPVLVNGKCEVLKGHCVKSNGGFSYDNFSQAVNYLEWFEKKDSNKKQYQDMCQGAAEYIREYYSWESIMDSFQKLTEKI